MNILIVVSDLGLGGAQQVVINLANELVRQNHNVWVFDINPHIRSVGMIERFDKKVFLISKNYSSNNLSFKYKFIDFILNRLGKKINYRKTKFKAHEKNLKKCLAKTKIDYVNSHICWADFYVYKKLIKYHHKWVISLHASYNNLFSIKKNINSYSNLARNAILSASKLIYIHDEGISFLERTLKINVKKRKKIYNGISLEFPKPKIRRQNLRLDKKDFVILCASRAIKSKGWYELAKAVAETMDPRIKLLFAGDGEILKDIKDAYSEYKSKIKFLGFQKDIHSLIHLSDLVCLPSQTEALPTILLESIFCNKLTLATNVGETANILENNNGKCGILLDHIKGKKLVEELKLKISFLLNSDIPQSKEPFETAKEIFSIKQMIVNYSNYFKS